MLESVLNSNDLDFPTFAELVRGQIGLGCHLLKVLTRQSANLSADAQDGLSLAYSSIAAGSLCSLVSTESICIFLYLSREDVCFTIFV